MMTIAMRWRHLCLVACVLIAGCQRAVGVTVSELPDGRLSILASESWSLTRPCVRQVWIRRQGSDHQSDYWSIYLKDGEAKCIGEFTYPLVPSGYERLVTPASDDLLRSGDVLQVEILGSGFDTDTIFTVS
jgi:hypothetical protein